MIGQVEQSRIQTHTLRKYKAKNNVDYDNLHVVFRGDPGDDLNDEANGDDDRKIHRMDRLCTYFV